MAVAINPITDATALAVDANLEPERRAQSLWHVWLRRYFSGTPFNTRAANGGVGQKTFEDCRLVWQEAPASEGDDAQKPEIHGALVDTTARRSVRVAGSIGQDVDRQLQFVVKVPVNLTGGTNPAEDPRFLARRVADQLAWLLRSSERAALAQVGVTQVRIASGPSILPTNQWHARLLVVRFRMRMEMPGLV